jgi:AcrR family transcriptional regulator
MVVHDEDEMSAATQERFARGEGGKLRDLILDAADALLDATGDVSAVSMSKIARAVKRTEPTVYAHFTDKASLIEAVCERTFERLGTTTDAALDGIDDPWARLDVRARVYVEFATQHPEHYRLLFSTAHRTDDDRDELGRLTSYAGFTGLRADVAACMEQGTMAHADIDLVALSMWSSIHGITSLLVTHPSAKWPPGLLDQMLHIQAAGLLSRDEPGRAPAPRTTAGRRSRSAPRSG